MSGIYIHIPFCKQACHYCNFHFSTSLRLKEKVVKAIILELQLQRDYLSQPPQTIYFGGGTPSILHINDLRNIFAAIHSNYDMQHVEEITIEVNPNDLNKSVLTEYRDLGFNRLSIGIQSFRDADLQFLNRAHSGEEALQCIHLSREVGFSNISIDLIYGIPNVTDIDWERNILHTIETEIPHISCYCLTVEEKTALKYMIETKKVPNVSEDQGAEQFALLMKTMQKHGYAHYEISNFCRPPYFSKHNTAYWQGKEYLGIGPAAHSFDGRVRQWNIANNLRYVHGIENKEIPCEKEFLTPTQQVNEYIMTSLRTMWGTDLQKIATLSGESGKENVMEKAQKFIHNETLIMENNTLFLSHHGRMIADYITLELFAE
ncbi:radical SAM family heme chaperone HemW [Candidatus Uabimicrobium amorphum]|uniref:Heme chaperone HemW n=1 Tax=Uabimicrobium amorphum TaxID=2596890 RepID=A0A5S9F341_UABAM|nr:radical SAM family heme chaperone HemW [Candidatus Uabimicrobium amorphum]BBM84098.1 coproporphyrinogen III oxidase [Candidatus Uabimicrobium amorphum]